MLDREEWDVYYIGDAQLGYGYTRWQAVADAPDLIRAEGLLHLSIKRFGEETVSEARMSVVETSAGLVRSFSSDTRLGPTPNVTRGELAGDKMQITTESGGQKRQTTLAWPRTTGGYFAIEESLRDQPMQPGETRAISTLMPIFNQIAKTELRAVRLEATELLKEKRELLRIETKTTLPGAAPIEGIQWTDTTGQTLKSSTPSMNQTSYRTTKAIALRGTSAQALDLGKQSLVKLSHPPADAHGAKQIRYRVHLDDADPAEIFVNDESQSVHRINDRDSEVTVRAIRPDDAPHNAISAGKPSDDDRRASSIVQSDDPRIIAMAKEAMKNVQGAGPSAVALERYVHGHVTEKNYSQTFATASEVAKTLEGDCTEHAVLLAALLRAQGIPARVAIGMVYVSSVQAFAFHMWTEAFVDGHWIGLDGTLGRGGVSAGHLKLATSSLQDETAFATFLPVMQVLGKLKIDVVDEQR
ncbi:MAG TPA: transglutaminase family protein [Pirellulales bacterium]